MAALDFLAFDLGAESGRALLGTLDQSRLTLEVKHRFANPTGRINGHLHWNLMGQWEDLKIGVRNTASASGGARGRNLAGIGVDTWGVDFGLISQTGEILGNPYHYRDTRTDGMIELACQRVGRERIFQDTGIQFMQLNTLFQVLAMHEAGSHALGAADTLLFMPDLFNYLFTGQRRSEFSIASTSQMLNPRHRTWASDLLEELGLPGHILPPIVSSGSVIGTIRADVAEECGIAADVPIIAPGCHDTASAVAAVPAEGSDNWCYISSGTWSLMGVELTAPIIDEKTLRYNYTNEGGVGGRIRLLKNIMGLWLVQECRREFAGGGHDHDYAELTTMAGDAEAFVAAIDPDYPPFLTPGDMPGKIERFCRETGQSAPTTPGSIIRTCLESLALTYRRTLDGLEDITGRQLEVIHIVGGGTQNELLNQMTADACGRSVIAGPVEATGIGNLLVQAMAIGAVKSLDELRGIVRNSFEVKRYSPSGDARWTRAYERYRELTAGR